MQAPMRIPLIVKFIAALIFVIVLAFVLYLGAVISVYLLGWVLGLLGSIF
jgi:hypothetical protein